MPSSLTLSLTGLACFAVGGLVAFFVRQWMASRRLRTAEEEARKLLASAREEEKGILLAAKEDSINLKAAAEAEYRERRNELQRQERRLAQKESNLERRMDGLERRDQSITAKAKGIEEAHAEVERLKDEQVRQLEVIAGMSSAEAKELLLKRLDEELRDEGVQRLHKMELAARAEAEKKSREILAQVIQRYTPEVVAEVAISTVPLPSDEMKGRLIGREGRNIRALEHATGVELLIDDTPETVTLSCFDPVRREIARIALQKLILDGRIHPARIEEMVQKAKSEVEATIQTEGDQAAFKAGVPGLHPELIRLLGRLKYRTSYGQNVLMHSLEVALLSGMIAAEIGASVPIAKKAGLLHDIGKALGFEIEGPHAIIGADAVKQWDKSSEVVQAVASHHGEAEITSVEGFIVATADAISGSRPGARSESLEHYLKRLEALESIANSFPGVEKSYAIQAGREVRVMVKPTEIDDLEAMRLARDIAKKVEESLNYPGQIKVTVVREIRVVEYAK